MSLCILPTQAHWLVLTYFGAFVMSKAVTCSVEWKVKILVGGGGGGGVWIKKI